MSAGSRRQVVYVPEVVFGTTPATPAMKFLRNTGGEGIKVARDPLVSAEMRSDRAVADAILGIKKPTLTLPFELTMGGLDDLFESLFFSAWAADVIKIGTTPKSFSIEEGFVDIPSYQILRGAMVNRLSLSIQPSQMVTGSIELIGKSVSDLLAAPLDAAPDPAPAGAPFNTFAGVIKEGGVTIAIITGLELSVENGLEAKFPVFATEAAKIGVGRANVSGTLTAYFESRDLAMKFLQETESSIEFTLQNGADSYIYTMPRVKYMDLSKAITENDVILTLPFQALHDSVSGTALSVERS